MRSAAHRAQGLLGQVTHRLATLWRFELRDGQVITITNHDQSIEFEGLTYTPSGAPTGSATEEREGLAAQNRELAGVVEDARFSLDVLRAGLLRGAAVSEVIVDWRYPWTGALARRSWQVNSTRYGGRDRWEAELAGASERLSVPVGSLYSRPCRYSLGDARCGVDLALFRSSVVTISNVSTSGHNTRTRFAIDDAAYVAAYAAGWSTFGYLTWVHGANKGIETAILKEERPGSNVVTFVLAESAPYDVAAGDKALVTAGCDRTLETCDSKFANSANHGGFPDIPGPDRQFFVPDAR